MIFMSENWKNIPMFHGFQASNLGNIRTIDRLIPRGNHMINRKSRILKQTKNKRGYLEVRILEVGKKPLVQVVHKLVMLTFVGPRPSGHQVNHKNGIKTDNRLENLEWVSASDNMKHAYRLNLTSKNGQNNGRAKLTESDIITIREQCKVRGSQKKLALQFGVTQTTISNIKSGKSWSS